MKRFENWIKSIISSPTKCKKWGHIFLVTAILLNGFVLALSLQLNRMQGELQNKRYDEQYFIINSRSKHLERSEYMLLNGISNQLILLRRLAEDRLTPSENDTILDLVNKLNHESETSLSNVLTITYLLANGPPDSADLRNILHWKNDSDLVHLLEKYGVQSEDYIRSLKARMITLMDNIAIWSYIHTSVLVLSTVILILGSILNLRSELRESFASTDK
jgi:cell division protein FtsX